MNKRVGILGSGLVGQTLANGFRDSGFTVAIGSRDGKTVDGWDGSVGTFADVAQNADIIVLSVKGMAAEDVVSSIGDRLTGKTVIDTTNPIADKPPEEGILSYFTSFDESLMERLQKQVPEAHFVKAFNSVGAGVMVKPSYAGVKPTMFICGNDADAKQAVVDILDSFGWDTEDLGSVKAARAIEPLCMLWCIPAILYQEYTNAFKLLKK